MTGFHEVIHKLSVGSADDQWHAYTGAGRGRLTVVSMSNTEFIRVLLFIYCCITTVNLPLATPVCKIANSL